MSARPVPSTVPGRAGSDEWLGGASTAGFGPRGLLRGKMANALSRGSDPVPFDPCVSVLISRWTCRLLRERVPTRVSL